MSYKVGDVVLWSRGTGCGYYGVILDVEMRPALPGTPPWKWVKVKFTTPLPPELQDGWFRCDHVNCISGYHEMYRIQTAMSESEKMKAK